MNLLLFNKLELTPQIIYQKQNCQVKLINDKSTKLQLYQKRVILSHQYSQTVIDKLSQRVKSLQRNIHKIVGYEQAKYDELCMKQNIIYIYYETISPLVSLQDVYNLNIQKQQKFSQKQVQDMLDSCLLGIHQLQKLGYYLENLDMCSIFKTKGSWIISDMSSFQTNIQTDISSPQQKLFKKGDIHQFCQYKSSLFRIGIIALSLLFSNLNLLKYTSIWKQINKIINITLKQKLMIVLELNPNKRTAIYNIIQQKEKISLKDVMKDDCASRMSTKQIQQQIQGNILEGLSTKLKVGHKNRRLMHPTIKKQTKYLCKNNSKFMNNNENMMKKRQNTEIDNKNNKHIINKQKISKIRDKMKLDHHTSSPKIRYQSYSYKKHEKSEYHQNSQSKLKSVKNLRYKQNIQQILNNQINNHTPLSNHQQSQQQPHNNTVSTYKTLIQQLNTHKIIKTINQIQSSKKQLNSAHSIQFKQSATQIPTNKCIVSQVKIGFVPSNIHHNQSYHYIDILGSHISDHSQQQTIKGEVYDYTGNHVQINFQNGFKYIGQTVRAVPQGYGSLYFPNHIKAYEGQWKSGVAQGKGVQFPLIQTQQTICQNVQIDCRSLPERNSNNWSQFEGFYSSGKRNGKGTLKLSNGDIFKGQWKNDYVNGEGIYLTIDGEMITGQWVNNILVEKY